MSGVVYLRPCIEKREHGYWPVQHHYLAVGFANADREPRLKLARMVNQACLICGGPTGLYVHERTEEEDVAPGI